MTWQVVPICEKQLRDVNPSDLLNNGLYRKCNIYKGGGGYDKFEDIYKKRTGFVGSCNNQFVVQLQGCPLRCPYCYVTPDGIFGDSVEVSTEKMIQDFLNSGCNAFHLMGGAPALYLNYWEELIRGLPEEVPFHSDLLLLEDEYSIETLESIAKYKNCLFAVSIKGANAEQFRENTGVVFKESLFWNNLSRLVECKVPFYLTFTGMSGGDIARFNRSLWEHFPYKICKYILRDSFSIRLVEYEALR